MKQFKIKLIETYQKEYVVFADSEDEAKEKVKSLYNKGNLELTDEDFLEYEIY